jgi:hypothetical protein
MVTIAIVFFKDFEFFIREHCKKGFQTFERDEKKRDLFSECRIFLCQQYCLKLRSAGEVVVRFLTASFNGFSLRQKASDATG